MHGIFKLASVSFGEKIGGMINFNNSMKDLADFINNNDLLDMEMDGVKFTCSNNKKGVDLIQVKLNRLLVLAGWEGFLVHY